MRFFACSSYSHTLKNKQVFKSMLFNLPFLEWFWIFKPSYEFAYFTIIPSISVILCFHFFRRVCLRLLRLIKRAKSSIDRKIQERSSTKLYAMCEVCSRKKNIFVRFSVTAWYYVIWKWTGLKRLWKCIQFYISSFLLIVDVWKMISY